MGGILRLSGAFIRGFYAHTAPFAAGAAGAVEKQCARTIHSEREAAFHL